MDKGIFPGAVKRSGSNVDNSPQSNVEVKKQWGCKSTPLYTSLRREQGNLSLPIQRTMRQSFVRVEAANCSKIWLNESNLQRIRER
jgi:hypothetical protein